MADKRAKPKRGGDRRPAAGGAPVDGEHRTPGPGGGGDGSAGTRPAAGKDRGGAARGGGTRPADPPDHGAGPAPDPDRAATARGPRSPRGKRAGAGAGGSSGAGEREHPHASFWTSRGQIAWAFGVSEAAVKGWLAKGLPPADATGRYRQREVIAWLRDHQLPENGRGIVADGDESEAELRRRKLGLECARIQQELDRQNEKLIPVAEVRQKVAALIRWCVAVMERAGPELAAKLAGKRPAAQKQITKDYFDAVREEAIRREPEEDDK